MTEAKRWKVYDGPQISPIFSGIVCMISASDRLIAVITEDETPVDPSTWSDIGRLIAAAPDLSAFAEEVRRRCIEMGMPGHELCTLAEAALSKAGLPQ